MKICFREFNLNWKKTLERQSSVRIHLQAHGVDWILRPTSAQTVASNSEGKIFKLHFKKFCIKTDHQQISFWHK